MAEKMALVGWQGITLKAPEDWSLVGVSGDEKKGYFRVDSPIASAIEVKWSHVTDKSLDLMVKGREFISALEKSSRKKTKFTSDLKQDKENSVRFSWRTDRLGQGRIVHCPKCERLIIAQVVSARDENISHISPSILGSIVDHREDGLADWALYGLEFAIPESYRIEKHSLMSGYLTLTFKDKGKLLVVERWGLANTLLNEYKLDEWYRKDALPDVKGYRVDIRQDDVHGHQGLIIAGKRSGIKQAAKALAHSLTLYPHPGLLTGYAWYCEDSNRLFSVRGTHSKGDTVVENTCDTITCHIETREIDERIKRHNR